MEKVGEECKKSILFFLFDFPDFSLNILYSSSIRHTVRCFACFCDYLLYAGISILCSSYYISVGTLLVDTLKNLHNHKHFLHEHHMSTRVRPDHTMMTVHLRTAAHAFMRLSTGPAQQLQSDQVLQTAGITTCRVYVLPVCACHLCQWI